MNAVSLTVVVPALDEEASLGDVLQELLDALPGFVPSFEILVVDDGSTDATFDVANRLARGDARIRVLRHPSNRGMGSSIRTGMDEARGELVCDVCADGEFDPAELARFFARARDADLVVGFRTGRRVALLRRILSALHRLAGGLVLGVRARDPAWIKMWRRSNQPLLRPRTDGFFWETEVLFRARRAGLRWVEVPSRPRPRRAGSSKSAELGRVLEACRALVRCWWDSWTPGAGVRA